MARPSVTIRTHGAAETEHLGEALGHALLAAGLDALLIDLRGDLGAGKTVLAGGIARGAGLAPGQRVVSPTFTIARSYALAGARLRTFHHIDAYRLRGPDDLDSAGFEDMWGTGRLTCVEWAENVEEALPVDRLCITLEHTASGRAPDPERPEAGRARVIRLAAHGEDAARVLGALDAYRGEHA